MCDQVVAFDDGLDGPVLVAVVTIQESVRAKYCKRKYIYFFFGSLEGTIG